MPLTFLTQDQRFIFVDHKSHQIIHPMNTCVGTTYDIYVVVKNMSASVFSDIQTIVWHSGLGLGIGEDQPVLTQPQKVSVPASSFGLAGQATIAFQFTPAKAGRGTIHIRLEPDGPTIKQGVTSHQPFERDSYKPPSLESKLFYPMVTGTRRGLRILAVSLE
jgi:hypothetical protein